MRAISRRELLKSAAVVSAAGSSALMRPAAAQDAVKLGILHSLTGTIAIAEASIVDAEKLAIDEINAGGGVMGKKIEPVVEDGASDWPTFAEKTKKLLQRDKVAAIIGCYTSASRKAVLPALNQLHGLLYYPTYYEGQEIDKSVIYTSQEATQSVIAAIEWMAKQQGQELLSGRLGLHLSAHLQQDRQADDHESRRQGAGRGVRPAGPHRVLVDHQQDQVGQAGLDLLDGRRRQQRRLLQAVEGSGSRRREAERCSPPWFQRTRSTASARRTPSATTPAWVTSRA